MLLCIQGGPGLGLRRHSLRYGTGGPMTIIRIR